jgi:ATP-dependent DNA helicase RecG
MARKLIAGTRLLLTGSRDKRGFRVSEHEPLSANGAGEESRASEIVPVHPGTEQLKPQRIRQWAELATALAPNMIEPLPAELRARRGLAGVADAVTAMHFPERDEDIEEARRRLAFEELFLYQAILAVRKRSHRVAKPAPRLGGPGEVVGRWLASLPFAPTGDQRQAFGEIDADIDSGEPMQRLLMGEVGSGKTVVAVHAMLRSLEAGFQAALMPSRSAGCSPLRRRPSRCSPARHRPRAGGRPWSGWRRVSSGSWSAPTH